MEYRFLCQYELHCCSLETENDFCHDFCHGLPHSEDLSIQSIPSIKPTPIKPPTTMSSRREINEARERAHQRENDALVRMQAALGLNPEVNIIPHRFVPPNYQNTVGVLDAFANTPGLGAPPAPPTAVATAHAATDDTEPPAVPAAPAAPTVETATPTAPAAPIADPPTAPTTTPAGTNPNAAPALGGEQPTTRHHQRRGQQQPQPQQPAEMDEDTRRVMQADRAALLT